jgi:hypothetical protein
MAERMKAETFHHLAVRPVSDVALFADHASPNRCRAKVILDQLRSATGLLAAEFLGRENEVVVIGIHRLPPPTGESIKQQLGRLDAGA